VASESDGEDPRGNMRLEQPEFPIVHAGVGLGDLSLAFAQRLHFGPGEDQATFEGLEDLVVVAGATIRGDHAVAVRYFGLRLRAALLHLLGSSHESSVPRATGESFHYRGFVLTLTSDQRDAMVATCIRALPDEGCGLLLGTRDGVVSDVIPSPNIAASAKIYEIDPKVLLRTFRRADDEGLEVLGVFHSHTHSPAYPSPTDIRQAPDPGWHYVLISLATVRADVRSYSVVDAQVTEENVRLEWVTGPRAND
jgi:proteasome lid subunit RPN8/RPN11